MADATDDLTNLQLTVQQHVDAIERAVPGVRLQEAFDNQLLGIVAAKPTGQAAIELWQRFSARPGVHSAHFPVLRRADVASELLQRLLRPWKIDQGGAGLCGPASLLFDMAGRYPHVYVKYAADLFDSGKADVLGIHVVPSESLRKAPKPARVGSLDWLTMASLRNSENLPFFDYSKPKDLFAGITLPHEMESWLKTMGYTDVQNETDMILPVNNTEKNIEKVNKNFADGAKIFLFINSNLMYADKYDQSSKTANHWVALMSKIDITNRANVRFRVYSWGQANVEVPPPGGTKTLELSMLLGNYYGYVSGKH